MSQERGESVVLEALARFVSFRVAGAEISPRRLRHLMSKALERADDLDQIDLTQMNQAFALVSCRRGEGNHPDMSR